MDPLDKPKGFGKCLVCCARLRSQLRGRKFTVYHIVVVPYLIACLQSQVALVSLPRPGLPVIHQTAQGSLGDRGGEGPPMLHFQESNWRWEDVSARGLGWLWQSGGSIKGPAPSSITATFREPHLAGGEVITQTAVVLKDNCVRACEIHCGFTWHQDG